MSLDVVGFGSLNFDYIYVVDSLAHGDEQVIIQEYHGSPGGSAANSIFALAKLGVTTGFLGAVGGDTEREQILTHMRDSNIDTSKIKVLASQSTSKVIVFVENGGERAMYSLPGASASTLAQPDEPNIDWLKKSKYVIFSAIPGKNALQTQEEIISHIHDDTHVVFMPGALYSKLGYSELKDIISHTYLLILNRRETQELTGREYASGAKWLVQAGCNHVVVTLSANGCLICTNDAELIVPTPELPKDKIVDSTGAGDAFTAGLIYGLLNDKPLHASAFYGNLSARACIQNLGARAGLHDKQKLESDFENFSEMMNNG